MTQELKQLTQEEHDNWVREQFQNANAHLAEHGLISDRVLTQESRYLAPLVALWKFTLQGMDETVWAISGDLPLDHIDCESAKTPQDALRYFSYRWQMKANKLLEGGAAAKSNEEYEYAQELIKGAENLFPLTEMEELWKEEV